VRIAAVETLVRQADEAVARTPLLDLFVSDQEESLRLRIQIADGLAGLGWTVGDRRAEVEKRLPDAFQIEPRDPRAPDARIKKKSGAKE